MIPNTKVYELTGNGYVEGMTQHQFLDNTFEGLVRLDAEPAGANSNLMAATAIATGDMTTLVNRLEVSGPFGRTVHVTSTEAGDLTVFGYDYLNQPMSETVTCIVGTVETTKAFASIDRMESIGVDGNVSFGNGDAFGLPFVVSDVVAEYADGATAAAPAHVAPDATDPATADTGDVRGTVVPTTTPDGAKIIELQIRFNPLATGGLYGVKQG